MDAREILKDALPTIEKFAPTIAEFIGGAKAGMATNIIVGLLSRAFNSQLDLSDCIMKHPECDKKLCELEEKHGEIFKDLINDLHISP